jgi:hypothetical protein
MPSELRSAASRSNGAKSHGPKSAETREISSRNSLKHGFTSYSTILLANENPDQFKELLADFKNALLPANAPEEDLVNQMVAARWRTMRIWGIETGLFNDEMDHQRAKREEQSIPAGPNNPTAGAFRALADESHALSLACRYESRLHRIYQRAYATLRELQQERQSQPTAAPPEPPPATPVEPESPPSPPPGENLRNEPSASRTLRQLRNRRAIRSRFKPAATPRVSLGAHAKRALWRA